MELDKTQEIENENQTQEIELKEEEAGDKTEKTSKKRKRQSAPPKRYEGWTFLGFKTDKLEVQDREEMDFQEFLEEVKKVPESDLMIVDGKLVVLKKTEEQQKAWRREYRAEYRTRPEVEKKRKLKGDSPTEKEKRKKYSSDPAVKERKKKLSRARREVLRILREKDAELYNQVDKTVKDKYGLDIPNYKGNKNYVLREAWCPDLEFDTKEC